MPFCGESGYGQLDLQASGTEPTRGKGDFSSLTGSQMLFVTFVLPALLLEICFPNQVMYVHLGRVPPDPHVLNLKENCSGVGRCPERERCKDEPPEASVKSTTRSEASQKKGSLPGSGD